MAAHFPYWSGVNDHLGSVEDSDFKDGITSSNFRIGRSNGLSVSSLYQKIKDVEGNRYSVNTSTGEISTTKENGAGTRFDAYTVMLSWIVLM
ncbi:MAG: hypothetical protein HY037_07115 [Nitrospirae bacterium]|nr:hypothetical protein [Candidatus Troglogloeales bacterium]